MENTTGFLASPNVLLEKVCGRVTTAKGHLYLTSPGRQLWDCLNFTWSSLKGDNFPHLISQGDLNASCSRKIGLCLKRKVSTHLCQFSDSLSTLHRKERYSQVIEVYLVNIKVDKREGNMFRRTWTMLKESIWGHMPIWESEKQEISNLQSTSSQSKMLVMPKMGNAMSAHISYGWVPKVDISCFPNACY